MKGCICHFTKWQIHPFISEGTNYILCNSPVIFWPPSGWVYRPQPRRKRADPPSFSPLWMRFSQQTLCSGSAGQLSLMDNPQLLGTPSPHLQRMDSLQQRALGTPLSFLKLENPHRGERFLCLFSIFKKIKKIAYALFQTYDITSETFAQCVIL